jgi:hypothetical protein
MPFQDEVRNTTMWWEFPVAQADGAEPPAGMAPKESQPRNLRVHLRGQSVHGGKGRSARHDAGDRLGGPGDSGLSQSPPAAQRAAVTPSGAERA